MTLIPATGAMSETFQQFVGRRIEEAAGDLARRWVERLKPLLPVDAADIFPTERVLDHVPRLLRAIGSSLREAEEPGIGANTSVIEQAQELGALRHEQQASVHQLLREYDLLAELLDDFVIEVSAEYRGEVDVATSLVVPRRLGRAVRTLMRATVDTFVTEYAGEVEQRTQELESFNRMSAHELRNSLATVRFAAEALTREPADPNVRRLAEVIRQRVQHAAQVLTSIEQLTARGAESPSQQEIGLSAVAADVAAQLEAMARTRGVEIRVTPDLPALTTDPGLLELALLNLVSNAVKYADPARTGRMVRIDAVPAGGGVRITVEDNGLGIPADAIDTIFERFARAHADRDSELDVQGSGLGLSIVKESIEALGGTIRCNSEVGKGTTFTIELSSG